MHFSLQAVSNNRVKFNLFSGVHDLFIRVLFPSSDPTCSVTCTLSASVSLSLPLHLLSLFLSITSIPPESRQYDVDSSQSEPGSLRAPRALRPSFGGQPQSVRNHSSTVSPHRRRSSSDEAHLLWLTWRTGILHCYSHYITVLHLENIPKKVWLDYPDFIISKEAQLSPHTFLVSCLRIKYLLCDLVCDNWVF